MPTCDCSKVPFKPSPPCFSICAGKLLGNATREQLVELLGLDTDIADRIFWHAQDHPISSLRDFDEVLGTDRDAVVQKIQRLTQYELTRLRSTGESLEGTALA